MHSRDPIPRPRSPLGGTAFVLLLASTASRAGDIDFGPYLQDARPDGILVAWGAMGVADPPHEVEYGPTTACGLGPVPASATEPLPGFVVYSAEITGLDPDTVYYYRVRSGPTVTPAATFRTAPGGASEFRFYAYGDSRTYPESHARVAEAIHADGRRTLVLHTGDIVHRGYHAWRWKAELFDPAAALLASVPLYPARGNHEDSDRPDEDAIYEALFRASWYSFDYGGVHFTSLNVFDEFAPGSQQYDWLVRDLAGASVTWKIVILHFAPYTPGPHGHDKNGPQRVYLHPLFSEYGVSLVLAGHNHVYARYEPIDGVTYITTGGGGAELHTDVPYPPYPGERIAKQAAVYHYLTLDVSAETITVTAVDLSGNVLDGADVWPAKPRHVGTCGTLASGVRTTHVSASVALSCLPCVFVLLALRRRTKQGAG